MAQLKTGLGGLQEYRIDPHPAPGPAENGIPGQGPGAGEKPPPFLRVDGVAGIRPRTRLSHPHLHEHEGITIARDEIDLSSGGTPIPVQDPDRIQLQPPGGDLFGATPAFDGGKRLGCPFIRHGIQGVGSAASRRSLICSMALATGAKLSRCSRQGPCS